MRLLFAVHYLSFKKSSRLCLCAYNTSTTYMYHDTHFSTFRSPLSLLFSQFFILQFLSVFMNEIYTVFDCYMCSVLGVMVVVLLWALENENYQDGCTVLMYAARYDRVDCVRLLIDAGANKEAKDNVRFRPPFDCCPMSLFLSLARSHLHFLCVCNPLYMLANGPINIACVVRACVHMVFISIVCA